MRARLVLFLAPALLLSQVYADPKTPWDASYKRFKGDYLVYSGSLGEQQPPTRTDRKASFMIEGPLAKEMFESIGPDLKEACGASSGLRMRQKGDLDCSYDKEQPSAPYTCHFGLNLRTGKSIAGSIC